jgi:hypothetical protein
VSRPPERPHSPIVIFLREPSRWQCAARRPPARRPQVSRRASRLARWRACAPPLILVGKVFDGRQQTAAAGCQGVPDARSALPDPRKWVDSLATPSGSSRRGEVAAARRADRGERRGGRSGSRVERPLTQITQRQRDDQRSSKTTDLSHERTCTSGRQGPVRLKIGTGA